VKLSGQDPLLILKKIKNILKTFKFFITIQLLINIMISTQIKLRFKLINKRFCTQINSKLRNTTPNIEEKINRKLWLQKNHPLNILRNKIVSFFNEENKHMYSKLNVKTQDFTLNEDLSPIVSLKECFDDLLVPLDHETRSPKNTYYWDDSQVLRTHMTAHDVGFIEKDITSFISIGDVYRRDSIDATHYPVFHQVDAVRLFDTKELTFNPYSSNNTPTDIIKEDLKYFLENFIQY
jgi:phenylalanyl-tRNA synthetase alpha subunit